MAPTAVDAIVGCPVTCWSVIVEAAAVAVGDWSRRPGGGGSCKSGSNCCCMAAFKLAPFCPDELSACCGVSSFTWCACAPEPAGATSTLPAGPSLAGVATLSTTHAAFGTLPAQRLTTKDATCFCASSVSTTAAASTDDSVCSLAWLKVMSTQCSLGITAENFQSATSIRRCEGVCGP